MSASLLSHRQQASSSYGTLDDSSVSPAQSAMMSATKVIVDADLDYVNPDSDASFEASDEAEAIFQRRIRLKVDFRLCTIAGILYTREEQQLRFAFLQSGQVIILATGSIVNFGLNHLDGRCGLEGWRWMFIVQGSITCLIGIITYWWIVDFPENSHRSFKFLTKKEAAIAANRIQRDRADVQADAFAVKKVLVHALDPKVYGLCCLFFLQNIVSTALSYFLPIILQSGMGFSSNAAILLSAPPYYYAVLPALLSSLVGDKYRIRGPIITFNCICVIVGFCMLGLAQQVAVRYVGAYLVTGAYVANWAALMAYQANNIVGQWKRVFTAAICTAFNGAGGIAGSYIVRSSEAPRYPTAVWTSIGSHILMIGIVAVFSIYFTIANKAQKQGTKIIERTEGFRFTI
ncbi:hypothetical protein SLS57_001920 [Botryosphaeria dothidea]